MPCLSQCQCPTRFAPGLQLPKPKKNILTAQPFLQLALSKGRFVRRHNLCKNPCVCLFCLYASLYLLLFYGQIFLFFACGTFGFTAHHFWSLNPDAYREFSPRGGYTIRVIYYFFLYNFTWKNKAR